MPKSEKYGSVGVIIHRDKDGEESYSEPGSNEEVRGKTVSVIENTSTKPQHIQNIGTSTDIIMAPGSIKKMTIEDEIRGVPSEIRGTGVKKKKYDPEKHDRPNPMTGGMPGMEPVDARESLPDDHPAHARAKHIEKKLGKPLIGMGTAEEVRQTVDEVRDIAKKEGLDVEE